MKNWGKGLCLGTGLLAAATLLGCSSATESPSSASIGGKGNPADEYCVQAGGKVVTRQNADGTYSLCSFSDGVQVDSCELYRANHNG